MAQFKLKKEDKKDENSVRATFNKADDFKAVRLIKKSKDASGKDVTVKGEVKVLHKIQADRLIEKGKAVEEKNIKLEAKKSTRTIKKLDE